MTEAILRMRSSVMKQLNEQAQSVYSAALDALITSRYGISPIGLGDDVASTPLFALIRPHWNVTFTFALLLLPATLALTAITGFSYFPLQIATYFGFISAGVAIVAIPVVAILRMIGKQYFGGQATTLIAVLFLGGVQLISLGILGEYIGRIYDEAKGRPLYIVALGPRVNGGKPGSEPTLSSASRSAAV